MKLGLTATPAAMAHVGLRYAVGGWLSLGAGLGFTPGLRDASAGLGVSSAQPSPGGDSQLGTDRLVGSLSALVDVNAATGLHLQGVRPYVGAALSVGHVSTPAGLVRDGAAGAVAVPAMSGSGVAWGATAGSNVTLGDGLSLDFAYRYTGQEATGPLDHGAALGLGAGSNAGGATGEAGGDHGMSIGLRLKF